MAVVDKIVVTQNGSSKDYSPESWKSLPLPERVKLIKFAAFFSNGQPVDPKAAVTALR